MIEGSGAGSVPYTNGSGAGRPKNIRIRIRNTGPRYPGTIFSIVIFLDTVNVTSFSSANTIVTAHNSPVVVPRYRTVPYQPTCLAVSVFTVTVVPVPCLQRKIIGVFVFLVYCYYYYLSASVLYSRYRYLLYWCGTYLKF